MNISVGSVVSVTKSYLPGAGDYYDQEDSAPRVRPAHCTTSGLTPATTSNRRGSGAKFLIVGLSVRADPVFLTEIRNYIISFSLDSKDLCVCK